MFLKKGVLDNNEKWNSTGSRNKPVTVSKNEPYKYKDIQKEIVTNNSYSYTKGGGKKGYTSDMPPTEGKYLT